MSNSTYKNLEAVRSDMRKVGVDAVIIPGTDPHQSEYLSDYWKLRQWVSGFTGENGTAVITLEDAALWTDSRFFLQAEEQLQDSGFVMHRENGPNADTYEDWLKEMLPDGGIVAIDGRLFTVMQTSKLEQFCLENGMQLVTDYALAERVWADRPAPDTTPAEVHDEAYAGETVASKLERICAAIESLGGDALFLSSLDDIAWVLNIRGWDISYVPVVTSYLYVSQEETVLFIDKVKLSGEVAEHLKKYGVRTKDYDAVVKYLGNIKESVTVLIDPNQTSDTLSSAIATRSYVKNPVLLMKGIKNDVQLEGFRKGMERDGAALVRTFMWIEKMAPTGTISEIDVAAKLAEERSKMELYKQESFAAIVGYKEHGAIVHYEADEKSSSTLQGEGLLLIDTGGQYLDSTTDITRTVSLGNPTEKEKHDYTLVLKGHLALSKAVFPVHTRGCQLDVLARQFLWNEHMTFFHGTGHGVGHFLGVHEGPQSIRTQENPVELVPGMVTSNEPGLYKAGEYGIRTENCVLVVPAGATEDFGDFLKFETLTLFPYDTTLIDMQLMSPQEVAQVNEYHSEVLKRISPYLNAEEVAWLEQKTKTI